MTERSKENFRHLGLLDSNFFYGSLPAWSDRISFLVVSGSALFRVCLQNTSKFAASQELQAMIAALRGAQLNKHG